MHPRSFKGLVAQSVSETPPVCLLPKTVNSYVRKQSTFFFVCLLLKVYLCIWLHRVLIVACGILVPRSGMEPGALHWELRVSATGRPGKSLHFLLNNEPISYFIHDWIARALRAGIIAYTVLLFYTT